MKKTEPLHDWFRLKGWNAFPFQEQCWSAYLQGKSGLLNAPTGSGKTFALALPVLLEAVLNGKKKKPVRGKLQAIWITPIRALAKDLQKAIQEAADALGLEWSIALRTGDTNTSERQRQRRQTPEFLITTPESLHLMLAQKQSSEFFGDLKAVITDEWHELLGTKRGVQVELGLSRLRTLSPLMRVWGISATIGNLEQAMNVLHGFPLLHSSHAEPVLIKAKIKKKIEVISLLPDVMEQMPWGGHLGIKLLDKVLPVIYEAGTSLIFTNTRSQTEIWYQRLLEASPDLAGQMAMHHGSLSNDMRAWVEESLHSGELKAVVCTSSLDLGVDFRPVEQIIQIGSPRGVSRFLQRAGRSGHRPDATSKIYFVPTNALELMEASALRKAIAGSKLESRDPVMRAFDVLCQYLVTLAVGDGFDAQQVYHEVQSTFCFHEITEDEWQWVLHYITQGGNSLYAYDEFKKVELVGGLYKVTNRKIAMRHRLSIGTISSDPVMFVKLMHGGHLGTIEEWFISRLKIGDVFWFAGKSLEIVQIKDMTVFVRNVKDRKGTIPQWQGGRMPLSSQLAEMLRAGMDEYLEGKAGDREFRALRELLDTQQRRSVIPHKEELLIEKLQTRDGYHVFVYPFDGRNVHEGLAGLVAYRIGQIIPITFSIAFNDYGFELLSDQPIPIEEALGDDLFSEDNLFNDILHSINSVEMARRRFRDIARIAGLIFTGYPGKSLQGKHLQASSGMFFEVFREHEPDNLLIRQAYEEVLNDQLEEVRMRRTLKRINAHRITVIELERPSPFCFPIMVERFRETMTTESIEDRVRKMQAAMEKEDAKEDERKAKAVAKKVKDEKKKKKVIK